MLNNRTLQHNVASSISEALGKSLLIDRLTRLSGGCISASYALDAGDNRFFIKINDANRLDMFEAEQLALNEINNAQAIRVPTPVCTGHNDLHAWLVLEFVSLSHNGSHCQLGEQLAGLHRPVQAYFGWHTDNTIGSTPQINTRGASWTFFFQQHRLKYQLELALQNGCTHSLYEKGAELISCLPDFFIDYSPQASLLHGDLWSGNYAFAEGGIPVIYDPASYYGDREADIAMTELFGGFSPEFRSAYESTWPLDPGYAVRRNLYNCYHVLNHFNLFAGGYARQAEEMINRLLSERNA